MQTPQFDLEAEGDRFVWMRDRGQRVALLDRENLTVELLHAEPSAGPRPYSLPKYYHNSTYHGARMTVCWWLDGRQKASSSRHAVTFDSRRGDACRFRVEETFGDDGSGEHDCCLRLSPDGLYEIEFTARLRLRRPCPAEFANFIAFGVGEAWRDRKWFTHTLWTNRNDRLLSLPHNPVHPFLPGARDVRQRTIVQGGFLGFFAAGKAAWLARLDRSNQVVASATCDNSYDEHLHCIPPTRCESDGLYHWDAGYRLTAMRTEEAGRCLPASSFIEPFDGPDAAPPAQYEWPGFQPGKLNDLESPVRIGEPFCGPCWRVPKATSESTGAAWDLEVGCSGRRSLRLQSRESRGRSALYHQAGPSIFIATGKRYRFTAMVKMDLARDAAAFLRAEQAFYTVAKVERCNESNRLTGRHEWTPLQSIVTPVDYDPYVLLSLNLEGQGTAWFDDISLSEIKA